MLSPRGLVGRSGYYCQLGFVSLGLSRKYLGEIERLPGMTRESKGYSGTLSGPELPLISYFRSSYSGKEKALADFKFIKMLESQRECKQLTDMSVWWSEDHDFVER